MVNSCCCCWVYVLLLVAAWFAWFDLRLLAVAWIGFVVAEFGYLWGFFARVFWVLGASFAF